jgi:hypothetical protein
MITLVLWLHEKKEGSETNGMVAASNIEKT